MGFQTGAMPQQHPPTAATDQDAQHFFSLSHAEKSLQFVALESLHIHI